MPAADQVLPKRKAAPRTSAAPPRQADQGDTSRSRPAPAPQRTRAFQPPLTTGKPFAQQQAQAQTNVRQARRALPAPALAQPPIISQLAGTAKHTPGGQPMTRTQVVTFLQSQHQASQAARHDIVSSIRTQIGNVHGQERIDAIGRLMDEIATDPRLAKTRQAIRFYTHLEQETARPQTTAELKPGPPDTKRHIGVGPLSATINTTALSDAAARVGAKVAPTLQIDTPETHFFKAGWSDIAHLPLMVPQTAYEITAAAKEAAGGDTKRAKALAKGLLDGVYGHLLKGDVNGALEYFRQHPVYAILELRGGKGVVGRGFGAAMRSGALGETARSVASTARTDINLAGRTGARVADRQHYSPDVMTKLFQVAVEKARGEGATVMRDHRLRRRADFESDTAAATSRTVRHDEAHQAKAAKPKGPLAEVVGLVVQGVVRPNSLRADLEKEVQRLDHAHAHAEFSTGAQKRQNRTTADAIRSVLGSPQAMRRIGEIAQSGRANVRAINTLETKAVDLGAMTADRAERAKLFPAAQAHLGATYSDAPFRAARAREVAAGRSLRDEATRLRQRVAQARETEQQAQDRVKTLAARHRSERGREGHNTQIAAYYVGNQRFDLRADAIQAAKTAGVHPRDIRRVSLTASDAKRVGELSQARRAVQAAGHVRRQAEADLRALNKRGAQAVPARKAFEDARSERKAAAIGGTQSLNVAGQRITNDEIKAQAGLTEPVAHLPHHTQARGARAYYQTAFAGRKNLDTAQKRTGAAFEKGAVDSSYQAVVEHRVRLRGIVNRIAEHDRIIHSISITGPKTAKNPHGMMTWDQAEKIANNAADNGAKLVPYRAVPGSYDQARIAAIAAGQDAPDLSNLQALVGHEFEDRLKAPAPGDRTARNVVLVPEQIVNQLRAQHAVTGTVGKAGNVAADVFRRTTLPFSTKWLVGNIVEAGIRLGAVGAGPNAYRIGRNLLKELDAVDHDEALRVKSALTGGLLYGNRGLTVQRFHEHFQGTSLEAPAKAAGVVGHLPVVHQLGQLIKHFTDGVFTFNRFFESAAQTAALGKYAKREMQEMTGSWAKATRAQQAALQDVAKGLTDTKNMHDAARYVDQTLGQYSRFSPAMRRFVQTYTPFVPWYLNAVRFTFWTLPAKHPVKTGLMALAANNLQADYDANHKGLPPGDLSTSIVADNGKVLPFGHYVPFGAFGPLLGGGNEQLTALVDPFFPQFKSAALAAFGLNYAGHQAKIDPQDRTGPDINGTARATMALNSLLEAFVPALRVARQIREGGATAFDNSTALSPKTKPGTGVGTANRVLNPFRSTPGLSGGSRQPAATVAPKAAPVATQAPEDDFWSTVDQSTAEQDAQDQADFWNSVGG